MDLKVNESIIQDFVETWDPECMEECAEFIQQISKCIRGKEDKKHLTDKVANVIISIHILKLWEKQNRTDLRIQKEKKI